MNNQKLMTIAIMVAALILSGAIAYVQLSQSGLTGDNETDTVTIEQGLRSCTQDDQCIVVDTKCSFCCNYAAINSKFEPFFNQLFDQTCKTYRGAYCECHDLSSYPACISGLCEMVKWSAQKPALPGTPQTITPPPAASAPTPAPASTTPSASVPEQPYPATSPPVMIDEDLPPLHQPIDEERPTPLPEVTPEPHDAFGGEAFEDDAFEDNTYPDQSFTDEDSSALPNQEPEAPATQDDDLFAPLPQSYTPAVPPELENVEIIEP